MRLSVTAINRYLLVLWIPRARAAVLTITALFFYAGRVRSKFSKLSHYESNRFLEHFVAGVPARTAAELVSLNRPTAVLFYHRLR